MAVRLDGGMFRQVPVQRKGQDAQTGHADIRTVNEEGTKVAHVSPQPCRHCANWQRENPHNWRNSGID
jgi:hypothetical protein